MAEISLKSPASCRLPEAYASPFRMSVKWNEKQKAWLLTTWGSNTHSSASHEFALSLDLQRRTKVKVGPQEALVRRGKTVITMSFAEPTMAG